MPDMASVTSKTTSSSIGMSMPVGAQLSMSGSVSSAVVNGQLVRPGSSVGETGAQVHRIERGYVVFVYKRYKFRKEM